VYTVLGDKRAALRDLGDVLRLNPTLKQARERRSGMLIARCELDQAAADLQQLANNGGNADQIGNKISEMQQVRAHVERAKELSQDPSNAAEAKQHIEAALKVCTESMDLLTMSIKVNLELGNYEQVIVDSGRAIKIDRDNLSAYAIRAEAYYKIGELDSALKHLREGLRHDPEHKQSQKLYKLLRKVERKLKAAERDFAASEWEDAISQYKGALKEDPNHKVHRTNFNLKICEAHKNLKQGAAAVEACSKCLEADERNVEVILHQRVDHLDY
jgi:tetratricopeptide (TPR) repeat protein